MGPIVPTETPPSKRPPPREQSTNALRSVGTRHPRLPLALFGLAPLAAQAKGAPAPTAPFLADFQHISAGDTAWMPASTAHLLLMTLPGLAQSLHREQIG